MIISRDDLPDGTIRLKIVAMPDELATAGWEVVIDGDLLELPTAVFWTTILTVHLDFDTEAEAVAWVLKNA